MNQPKYSFYFLLLCLACSLVVAYFVLKPFFAPLILAAVFAFLFQPVYQKLLRAFGDHPSLAAFATTVAVLIVIIAPLAFLGTRIFQEANYLYGAITGSGQGSLAGIFHKTINEVYRLVPVLQNLNIDLNQYIKRGLDVMVQNLGMVFSNIAKIIFGVFVFLAAFYFLLKDGRKLKEYLVKISPLASGDNELIIERLRAAVSSVIKGNLFIGLMQGALTGIGFAALGVPNAFLWGTVTVVAALVPGIGTALVTVPAVIFLFVSGNIPASIALLVWGSAVGLIDNVIRPKLVGDSIQMHPFAVFLMVIGGIVFFGPVGFLLGPLVMVLVIALIDIYLSLRLKGVYNHSEHTAT